MRCLWITFVTAVCLLFPPGGYLGKVFARYVPLASQNPYPIITKFWSVLLSLIDPILVTFGHYSIFLVYSQLSLNGHFYKTDTSLRRTTDTLKQSTDTCEVVFSVKNTSKRNFCAENDSKLRITEAKFLLQNSRYVEKS